MPGVSCRACPTDRHVPISSTRGQRVSWNQRSPSRSECLRVCSRVSAHERIMVTSHLRKEAGPLEVTSKEASRPHSLKLRALCDSIRRSSPRCPSRSRAPVAWTGPAPPGDPPSSPLSLSSGFLVRELYGVECAPVLFCLDVTHGVLCWVCLGPSCT